MREIRKEGGEGRWREVFVVEIGMERETNLDVSVAKGGERERDKVEEEERGSVRYREMA